MEFKQVNPSGDKCFWKSSKHNRLLCFQKLWKLSQEIKLMVFSWNIFMIACTTKILISFSLFIRIEWKKKPSLIWIHSTRFWDLFFRFCKIIIFSCQKSIEIQNNHKSINTNFFSCKVAHWKLEEIYTLHKSFRKYN